MLRDAQAYLNSQIYKATNEVGYEHMTNPNHQGNLAPEYSVFLQHTYAVFKTGLDRELYRQERELTVCLIGSPRAKQIRGLHSVPFSLLTCLL
ncbi:hypothetical protein DPMN_124785 [Dreissena polymorpha]|uniref:Uncharacterized protein n=1 Tax=Dreissena polymorpha TaxID=45954 RepID=A0A9D4GSR3_DREPO|nr:hypothetical protein DPMN_124785 [Dreissena polymorpha]